MSGKAAICANLVDVRNIAAHKCVRLEIHVPVEQASAVMAAFGWPTMVDPVPVGIARLDMSKVADEAPKTKRHFADLPLAQQVALRCNEPGFWTFLAHRLGDGVTDSDKAADIVRIECGVSSRSELNSNKSAAAKWKLIDDGYWAWSRGLE